MSVTFSVRVDEGLLGRLNRCVAESPHHECRNALVVALVEAWCGRAEAAREAERGGVS